MRASATCAVDGCTRPVESKAMCKAHYERVRLGRDMGAPIRRDYRAMSPMERLSHFSRVCEDGCIEWDGPRTPTGYGQIKVNGRSSIAHRVSYELHVGPIPQGLELDHLCRNRACINPDHLEAVTHKVNTLRSENFIAKNAVKTHCPQGHPYDEANTMIINRGRGRDCRICHRERARRRVARLRNAA